VAEHGLNFLLFGDICLKENRLSAVLFNYALGMSGASFVAVIIDKNVGAGSCETDGDCLSKSFTGTSNQRFLTFQY
jgi:hypothetical protein